LRQSGFQGIALAAFVSRPQAELKSARHFNLYLAGSGCKAALTLSELVSCTAAVLVLLFWQDVSGTAIRNTWNRDLSPACCVYSVMTPRRRL
jgi:hypothetical protein